VVVAEVLLVLTVPVTMRSPSFNPSVTSVLMPSLMPVLTCTARNRGLVP